jgi:hypothetical protein
MLESDRWLTIPVAVGPSAMPVEMIVNPAGMRAVWRTPKWPSPYCADNAADHRTNRPGDHQASAGPENRANSIRLRTRRSNGDRKNRCRSQQTLAHDRPPLSQPSSPAEPTVVPRCAGRKLGHDLALNVANYRRFPFARLFQSVVAEAPHLRAASSTTRADTANSRETIADDASTRTGR